jgi:site-specific recombinase XerD
VRAARLIGGTIDTLRWDRLRFGHVEIIRSRLLERDYSASLINATLSALRGVARRAWHLGMMTAEDFQRIKDVRGCPSSSERRRPVRALAVDEISLLLSACDRAGDTSGARDACLISLLYGAGLRRDEARSLQLSDYHHREHVLTVVGKGRKPRTIYVDDPGARRALHNWLRHRGSAQGPLLLAVSRGGRVLAHGISGQAIFAALRRRALQAGVARFSPHNLRGSYASRLFDEGADAAMIQKLLGHSSISTTQKYDLRSERARRRASKLVRVPFRRPR